MVPFLRRPTWAKPKDTDIDNYLVFKKDIWETAVKHSDSPQIRE